MKKMKKIICGVILFFISIACYGIKLPAHPSSYVNDYVSVLTSKQKDFLNNKLKVLDEQTTNQIFVAVFDKLGWNNLKDISMKLAEKWKPGVKKKDNGVLIVIFKKDRKIRIEVGYGLEHILPDAFIYKDVLQKSKQAFKENNYFKGLDITTNEIINRLTDKKEISDALLKKKRVEMIALYIFYGFLGILFLLFIFCLISGNEFSECIWDTLSIIAVIGGSSSGSSTKGGGGSFGGGGSSGSF